MPVAESVADGVILAFFMTIQHLKKNPFREKRLGDIHLFKSLNICCVSSANGNNHITTIFKVTREITRHFI
jgi:hypothetical protein